MTIAVVALECFEKLFFEKLFFLKKHVEHGYWESKNLQHSAHGSVENSEFSIREIKNKRM